jgi:hypothetical protein
MYNGPSGTSWMATYGELGNEIGLTYAGDAGGISADLEIIPWTTLTGWAAALTPGNHWEIGVCRDGDTSDTSTVNSYSGVLSIRYGSVQ